MCPTSLELCHGILEHFLWELSYFFGYGTMDWCFVLKSHTFRLEFQFWEEKVVTRVYGYDPETKVQSSQWKSPTSPSQKRQGEQVECKDHADCCLRFWNICPHIFAPQGQSVTKEYYLSVLNRLREKIRKKDPRNGRTIPSCCTMTMRQPTMLMLWRSLWLKQRPQC